MVLAELWPFLGALAVVYLLPGADMLLLLDTATARGRRAALAVAAGLAAARAAHVCLAAFGLAALDRESLGLGLTVFVGIKVARHNEEPATAFREAVRGLPQVVSCHLVSGEADFLLQVVVPDLAAYERFLLDTLLRLPWVADIRSNFAIQTVKGDSPLPLDHLQPTAGRG